MPERDLRTDVTARKALRHEARPPLLNEEQNWPAASFRSDAKLIAACSTALTG